jgi:hypothetical protein
MRKLKLELDALRVDSFDPAPRRAGDDGTVFGFYTEFEAQCDGFTEGGCGYTPYCPGYGCTARSTCKYPTAVYDNCAPGWTDDEAACEIPQPQTYYCAGSGGSGWV